MVQVDGLAVCKPLLCCVRPWPVTGSAEHVPFDPAVRESAAVATRAAVAMPAERIVSAVCVGATGFWRGFCVLHRGTATTSRPAPPHPFWYTATRFIPSH